MTERRPRRFKLLRVLGAVLIAGVLLAVFGVLGDLVYARVVEHRYHAWNAGIERYPDGVRVGCRAFTVGEGGPAILLIHGFGDGPPVFRDPAEALADLGYTCRVMRLPGFCEPMEAYSQTDLAQWNTAVQSEVSALRRQHETVWIAGHSTGATLAIRQALETPDEVDGLVLFAPLIAVSHERSPGLRPRTWFEMLNPLRNFTWIVQNAFDIDVHDPAAGDYPYRDSFVPISIYDDLYALLDEVDSRAGELTMPLLMFVAVDDKVVDADASRAFFEEAGSEPKERVERTDAGHVLPLDQGWEEMVTRTDAFIADRSGGAP